MAPPAKALQLLRDWPDPQVILVDKQGRLTERDGVPVKVAGPVTGKLVEMTIKGVAIFTNLTPTGGPSVSATTITLDFSSPGLVGVSADVLVNTVPPVAHHLQFVQAPPSNATDNVPFPPPPIVVGLYSNTSVAVWIKDVPISAAVKSGYTGTLIGYTAPVLSNASGQATFPAGFGINIP